jgi:predicted metal-binding membrane protein
MRSTSHSLEGLLRRDRAVAIVGLAVLAGLAWLYLVRLDRGMADMSMAQMAPWTAADIALAVLMWAVMMVAMMLPAAAPMILVFIAINRRRRAAPGAPYVDTGIFVLGYLAVWSAFSVGAAVVQWALHEAALLSPEMLTVAPSVGGALLVGAGLYQLTPLKYACLSRCQSPLGFVLREWREGTRGALVMGLRHGLFCLGCCWVLMALLFVGGVMNLVWVAAIAALALFEKVLPAGRVVSWAAGMTLIVWGSLTLARAA